MITVPTSKSQAKLLSASEKKTERGKREEDQQRPFKACATRFFWDPSKESEGESRAADQCLSKKRTETSNNLQLEKKRKLPKTGAANDVHVFRSFSKETHADSLLEEVPSSRSPEA